MIKLPQEFYARPAGEVAKDLIGRELVIPRDASDPIRVKLLEVAAYEGMTKRTSEGVLHAPGVVSISSKYKNCLFDIATGKEGQASCVTLRAGIIDYGSAKNSAKGPGKLTEGLGINRDTKIVYDGLNLYGDKLWIEGERIAESEIEALKGNAENCNGIYKLKVR